MAASTVAVNWGSIILHGVKFTEKEIGRGVYGRVFEVDYEGTLCVAKEVHALLLQFAQGNELEKIRDDFLNECQIWSTLRHPYVVQFLGVYYPKVDQYKLPVMVMEKMQHSLRGLVEKYDNIPLNVKLSILDEVCLGLRYLHSRNPPIVHRDLTPNNILLSYRLEAKITDLGVAKIMQPTDAKTMTKIPGTADFMPPECLADKPVYGLPLDIFSYGGVVLCTITQLWPQPSSWVQFEPSTGRRVYLSEIQRRQYYLDKMVGGAAGLKSLVISCLDDNPNSRPLVAQVSAEIKSLKDLASQKNTNGCDDGMSPLLWWAEVSSKQKSQVISSMTTSQKETTIYNKQLSEEIDVLKTENAQLKSNTNAMKDEIKELTTLVGRMTVSSGNQMEQINSQSSKIKTMEDENKQLIAKVQQLMEQLVLKESAMPSKLFSGSVNIKWEEGAPITVTSKGNTAIWLNGLVYVGGGYEAAGQGSHFINCYDYVKNLWIPPINAPYCFFAMTTLKNSLFIVGGQDKSYKRTNQILTLDTGQLKNYTKMITAKSSTTATGHQAMLIIAGGWDDEGKVVSSTELYDSNSQQWYTCNDLPKPCHSLKSAIVDNTLYLLGGVNDNHVPSTAVFSAPLDSLSRHQLKWNTHKDTPWCCSTPVGMQGTHLLIVGGHDHNKMGNNSYIHTSNIYKLKKSSHNWKVIGCIPSARSLPSAASTGDNKIIVIGGRNDNGELTNTVWIGSFESQ